MSNAINVVCTRMGALTPFGETIDDLLRTLPKLMPLSSSSRSLSEITGGGMDLNSRWGNCVIPATLFSNIQGSKYFDKCTKLLYTAVSQFLRRKDIDGEDTEKIGISIGTAFGTFTDSLEFTLSFEKDGFRGINPILFPNMVYNCPASQLAIILKVTGANLTITNGLCSGLDALIAGFELIRNSRVATVIVGGVEESSPYSRIGFYHCLKHCKGSHLYPVEAASAILLEAEERAIERNALIYGRIAGYAQSFFPGMNRDEISWSKLIEGTIHNAIESAEITFDEVGSISLSVNGLIVPDNAELKAVGRMLQNSKRPKALIALKVLIGETCGASGILQTIFALREMKNMPLHHHYQDCLPEQFFRKYRQRLAENVEGKYAIINNINWDGNVTSLIVECVD